MKHLQNLLFPRSYSKVVLLLSVWLLAVFHLNAEIPLKGVEQLIVSIAPDWSANRGSLQLFQKEGGKWKSASVVFPVLYGRNGLAWGRGVAGQEESGLRKVERDKRAPAGLFKIGKIYTYDPELPAGANYPFHTVGLADAWIDDPSLPEYNQFVTVDSRNPPSWFDRQKMRRNDFAYRWLVEIRHNSDPPIPNAGSAIFFHIRRGPDRPSAGCTTMEEKNLVGLIRWLRPSAHPHYVLLPESEYLRKWKEWSLPPPDIAPLP